MTLISYALTLMSHELALLSHACPQDKACIGKINTKWKTELSSGAPTETGQDQERDDYLKIMDYNISHCFIKITF